MSQYTDYNTYLNSDHWANLRLTKFERDGRVCCACGEKDKPLHVHHIRYKNLIDCTCDDLMVLCESCHNALHETCARYKFSYSCLDTPEKVAGLLGASAGRTQARKNKRLQRKGKRRARSSFSGVPRMLPFDDFRAKVSIAMKKCRRERFTPAAVQEMVEVCQTMLQSAPLQNNVETQIELERAGLRPQKPPSPASFVPSGTLITNDLVLKLQSVRGGWSRESLMKLGVGWPPKRGWRSAIEQRIARGESFYTN